MARLIVFLFGVAMCGFGALIFFGAQNTIHEAVGGITFLGGAVFTAAAMILDEIVTSRNKIINAIEKSAAKYGNERKAIALHQLEALVE